MVDTLPTFDEDYGSEGDGDGAAGGSPEGDESGQGGGGAGDAGEVAQSSGQTGDSSGQQGPGTRASGGMESDMGAEGPLTAAEQVAILDRQLEESTRDLTASFTTKNNASEDARDRAAHHTNYGQPL